MKESFWGYMVIVLGIIAISFIWFFASITNTDQQNYNLLKESVENAMFDALDLGEYRVNNVIKIDEEKFVESFLRRFSENASLANTYVVEIFDIWEEPPKVSLRVSTVANTSVDGEIYEFDIVNNIDAILEAKF